MNSKFGLGIVIGVVIGLLVGIIVIECSVQPIDVYRDKTELIVTYKNDVAVDSVVVYKMK